jgi:hypothetical protein
MPPAPNATGTWLSVLGADDAGESRLKYTWELAPVANNRPAGGDISFPRDNNGRHSASRILMTVNKAGTYVLRARVEDELNQAVHSDNVTVTFASSLSNLKVSPQFAFVPKQTTDALTAVALDQFGNSVSLPAIKWAVVGPGGGTVDSAGAYRAGTTLFARESITVFLTDDTIGGSATRDTTTNATVAARRIFYNNSFFDGFTEGVADPATGLNNDDNDALLPELEPDADPDPTIPNAKRALLPGQQANFTNYTSYGKGLNGVMIDLSGLPANRTITADDFGFKVGNSSNVSSWAAAPAPAYVSLRRGGGVNGSDRVTLIWRDNDIQNQWLQVTIKTTANAGLAASDVFYFGNLIGDTGVNSTGIYATLAEDYSRTRAAVDANPNGTAAIISLFDHNRDGILTSADYLLVQQNYFRTLLLLAAPT